MNILLSLEILIILINFANKSYIIGQRESISFILTIIGCILESLFYLIIAYLICFSKQMIFNMCCCNSHNKEQNLSEEISMLIIKSSNNE